MMNDKTFELSGEINNSTMKFVGYEVKKNGDDLYIRIKNRFLCREPDETKYVNRFHIQIDYSKTKDINKIYLQGKHAEEKELIWTDKRQTDKKKIK